MKFQPSVYALLSERMIHYTLAFISGFASGILVSAVVLIKIYNTQQQLN